MHLLSDDIRLGALFVEEERWYMSDSPEFGCSGCVLGTAAYARGWKARDLDAASRRAADSGAGEDGANSAAFLELYPDYPLDLLRKVSHAHFSGRKSRLELADLIEQWEREHGLRPAADAEKAEEAHALAR